MLHIYTYNKHKYKHIYTYIASVKNQWQYHAIFMCVYIYTCMYMPIDLYIARLRKNTLYKEKEYIWHKKKK